MTVRPSVALTRPSGSQPVVGRMPPHSHRAIQAPLSRAASPISASKAARSSALLGHSKPYRWVASSPPHSNVPRSVRKRVCRGGNKGLLYRGQHGGIWPAEKVDILRRMIHRKMSMKTRTVPVTSLEAGKGRERPAARTSQSRRRGAGPPRIVFNPPAIAPSGAVLRGERSQRI